MACPSARALVRADEYALQRVHVLRGVTTHAALLFGPPV